MAPPTLAFLRVDARRPLDDATVDLDDASSRGFVKLEARLHPSFNASDASRREYDVLVSAKTSHVNVMATSFAPGSSIAIDGVVGNMATRRVGDGTRVEVAVTSGGETTTYSLTTRVSSEMVDEGEVVMKEKPKVEDDGEGAHGHSHDGVPCDGTHHSHGEGAHGHSHDGVPCDGTHHSHAHGGESSCGHDHGGEKCDHNHGHSHEHGHGHGEKKEHSHGHGHSHGEKKCDDDKCGHDHGHGHGEKKEHSHGHGHHGHSHD